MRIISSVSNVLVFYSDLSVSYITIMATMVATAVSPNHVILDAENIAAKSAAVISVETTQMNEVNLVEGKRKKQPKRILHFNDGILEEYSTDEEDKNQDELDTKALIDPTTLSWIPYIWFHVLTFGTRTLAVCDYLGEHLARFFGITSPKYQYEIDEYHRMKEAEEKEKLKQEDELKGWNCPKDEKSGYQQLGTGQPINNQPERCSQEWESMCTVQQRLAQLKLHPDV